MKQQFSSQMIVYPGGVLAIWLGFPNDFLELPFLVLFWPVALAYSGRSAISGWSAFQRGWLISFTGMTAALYWLILPVHDVGGLTWPMAWVCAVCVTACLGSAGGLFSLVAYLLRSYTPVRTAVLLGLTWVFLEWCYAVTLGFPWLSVAGALAVWPLTVQATDLVGAYGVAGLWIFALLCLFDEQSVNKQIFLQPTLYCGAGMLCLLLLYGFFRLHETPLEIQPTDSTSFSLLFVEGNVDQNKKWQRSFQRASLELYMKLTENALLHIRNKSPEEQPLVIWPETAMPFFFDQEPLLAGLIQSMVRRQGCSLLFGAPGKSTQKNKIDDATYNRAFLLAPDGSICGYYDKEHLVPFGEYVPTWLNFSFLEGLLQGVGMYSAGQAVLPLRYDKYALGMLICYEGIFPWLAKQRVADGANILVDISNDGWFGASPAAKQHLYLTVLRALEQNRWILRGTNTGISAVIDTRGRIVSKGGQFKSDVLYARAKLCDHFSPFYLWQNWLAGAAFLLFFFLLFTKIGKKGNIL